HLFRSQFQIYTFMVTTTYDSKFIP
ncbi:unnamed protein product, partial [Rotaria magnacalcarata]